MYLITRTAAMITGDLEGVKRCTRWIVNDEGGEIGQKKHGVRPKPHPILSKSTKEDYFFLVVVFLLAVVFFLAAGRFLAVVFLAAVFFLAAGRFLAVVFLAAVFFLAAGFFLAVAFLAGAFLLAVANALTPFLNLELRSK